MLSSVLGRNACIDWFGGSLLYPNLFAILIGESTLLRKSTVINVVKKLVLEIMSHLKLAEQFSWEGLVDEMGYPIDENGKIISPKDKNFLTPEKKAQKIWLIDEYAAFLQGVNKKSYMADLKLLLTELYGCPPVYSRKLRKESAQVTKPYLNILGGTTAEVFIKALDPEDLKSGFLQRHLIIFAKERSRFISRPVIGKREAWKELGKWLIKKSSQVNKMQWSKEADQLFFDQIIEAAVEEESLKEAAAINPQEKFSLLFSGMLQSLFIERMEQNEDIFGKFMNEKEFQNVVSEWISEKVYHRLRGELSEKNTGQVTE